MLLRPLIDVLCLTPRCGIASAAVTVVLLLQGCGRTDDKPGPPGGAAAASKSASAATGAKPQNDSAAQRLLLAPEDVHTLQVSQRATGPVISGSLQPERRADLRAELAAVVLQVLKDNGEPVRAGELLVRLDDTAIRDNLNAAEETVRASAQAFEQSERQLQRLKTLQGQGMVSTQALEDSEMRRNASQNELVAARSRVVTARQQLRRTEVRAPFEGLISERKVSAGDTAQVGKELLKVMDPRSMRFEGLVAADRLHELKLGQTVSFRVNGAAPLDYLGKVQRIDSAANAATRQVEVRVLFNDPASAPKVAGLFAEGRVQSGGTLALMLPESTLQRAGDSAHVWKLSAQALQKTAVTLGERDPRSGQVPVLSGVQAGDQVLRNPGSGLRDGQGYEMARAVAVGIPAAAASASASAAALSNSR